MNVQIVRWPARPLYRNYRHATIEGQGCAVVERVTSEDARQGQGSHELNFFSHTYLTYVMGEELCLSYSCLSKSIPGLPGPLIRGHEFVSTTRYPAGSWFIN